MAGGGSDAGGDNAGDRLRSPRGAAYPVTPTYYYVTPATTFLRDCPGYECGIVTEVYSGDRVVVLDRNDFGWARVQLDRTGSIGWIPGDLLSYSPMPAGYYVAYSTVYLRDCADYNCRSVELLHRGDRVEKLDQDYRGWWRVRSYKTGNTRLDPGLRGFRAARPPLFLCGRQQPGPAGRPQHRQPRPDHPGAQQPGGDAGLRRRRLGAGAGRAQRHHRLGGGPRIWNPSR